MRLRIVKDPLELRALVPEAGDPTRYATVLGWGDPLRGVFTLVPLADDTVDAHVYVHPDARGREAIDAGKQLVDMARQAGVRLNIRPQNREASIYAALCGVKRTA